MDNQEFLRIWKRSSNASPEIETKLPAMRERMAKLIALTSMRAATAAAAGSNLRFAI